MGARHQCGDRLVGNHHAQSRGAPVRNHRLGNSGTCDLSRIGLASWRELSHLDDASLNILLFVPLGISIGLCPRSRAKLIVLTGAFVLPAAVELIQLVAVSLGRECQSADVVDNVFGLLLGLLAGSVAGRIWSFRPAASLTNADETDD